MDAKQRGVELGEESDMGEGRERGVNEERENAHVLLNAHHLRTDCMCCVDSVLPQTCGSDPESS